MWGNVLKTKEEGKNVRYIHTSPATLHMESYLMHTAAR